MPSGDARESRLVTGAKRVYEPLLGWALQIDVFVEASGFAANLNLKTNGTKQTVQIDSKGEIRGVNITLTKT